ncbi:MAG: type III secretion system export apparatus subunit SctV [Puniceicoccales bacterium]|jgi:type III secretion protein V|nr:type III secretion system export apparatus subunit SctV [Puniceicoccales bacterium]
MNFIGSIEKTVSKVSRFNDVLLAVLVVMIIALMIVPVPSYILDGLIALNFTISIVLLMMALYIPNVLAFSTFPSMLLFTTLFRLALSITTTRMILLYADAGEIIFTFGQFVVGGNFVVGAVIFLILLIVQFLVITKGAERVAEVAARFTLDAMPGKQMSIDADMRAGTIDMDEAKRRRSDLERENQLYGAMDGAMKFVKGDAIAGLIITAVDIIAGLIIGVTQKGMELQKALTTYSILTIGDGLVSQIPALLISITAGIIVTKVGAADGTILGRDIGKQVLGQPKALLIGGFMVVGMMLMPGFPKVPFMILASMVLVVGYTLVKTRGQTGKPKRQHSPMSPAANPQRKAPEVTHESEDSGDEFSVTIPLILDVARSVEETIEPDVLNEQLIQIRRALYHDLGVPFPGIHLRFNESLEDNGYRILLSEVPISQGKLMGTHVLVRESKENLDILGINIVEAENFLPNIPTLWAAASDIETLNTANIAYMRTPQILTYHLSFILKKYAGEFLGIQECKFLLENMEQDFPEIVREVQRVLPIQKITDIFQRLVQEEISIRNLKLILQCLIDWGQKEKEPVLLADYVRSNLRRYISYKFSEGRNVLSVYLLDPQVEEIVRKAVRQTSAGSYLALDPPTAKKLVKAIKDEVGEIHLLSHRPVLLTSMDIRRYIRKLIELEIYDLPVLSHQELTEEITIRPLGRVHI